MNTLPRDTRQDKFTKLQQQAAILTARIRSAELRHNPTQLERFYRRKARLHIQLRKYTHVS